MSAKNREDRLKNTLESLTNIMSDSDSDDPYIKVLEKAGASKKEIQYISVDDLEPAPKDWNFFPKLSSMKKLEMLYSIRENGLFQPILVWEISNGKHMILSGHNRVECYKELRKEDRSKYHTIPALVYGRREIDEDKAREIIIDTNYVQREEDKRILPLIVKNRMDIVKERKDTKGRTIDIVADELNIGRTTIYKVNLIATRVIPELAEMYFDGDISQGSVVKFAWYNEGVQRKLYEKHKDKISDETLHGLKRKMSMAEIEDILRNKPKVKFVNLLFKVPEDVSDEIKQAVEDIIKKREAR